jgi:hypothetical protein
MEISFEKSEISLEVIIMQAYIIQKLQACLLKKTTFDNTFIKSIHIS